MFYTEDIAVGPGVIAVTSGNNLFTFVRRPFQNKPWSLHRRFVPHVGTLSGPLDLSDNTIVTGGSFNFDGCILAVPLFEFPRLREWLARFLEEHQLDNPDLAKAHADPDLDGLTNEMEYALGLHPLQANLPPGSVATRTDQAGEAQLSFSFRLPNPVPAGVVYEVQASEDMQLWKTIATRRPTKPWSGPAQVSEQADVVTVQDLTPSSIRRTGYLRLAVTLIE